MGSILSEVQCQQIKRLNKRFEPYAKKGWMCEGSDKFGLCNCIFNNDTDEILWADYNGHILEAHISLATAKDARQMAIIQGAIRKV
jgi:hypothetical protein